MSVPQRIAITGASGLIGTALVGHLKAEGHTVQRLVRRTPVGPDEVQWDPQTGFVDLEPLRGVDAVIHLAGVGVGDKRWSKKYKSEILNSRLLGTTAIANAVAELKPQVFISASAIGWYGESGNRAVVETDRAGDDFELVLEAVTNLVEVGLIEVEQTFETNIRALTRGERNR